MEKVLTLKQTICLSVMKREKPAMYLPKIWWMLFSWLMEKTLTGNSLRRGRTRMRAETHGFTKQYFATEIHGWIQLFSLMKAVKMVPEQPERLPLAIIWRSIWTRPFLLLLLTRKRNLIISLYSVMQRFFWTMQKRWMPGRVPIIRIMIIHCLHVQHWIKYVVQLICLLLQRMAMHLLKVSVAKDAWNWRLKTIGSGTSVVGR